MIVDCSTTGSCAFYLLRLFKYGVMQTGFSRAHPPVSKKTAPSCSQNASLYFTTQSNILRQKYNTIEVVKEKPLTSNEKLLSDIN